MATPRPPSVAERPAGAESLPPASPAPFLKTLKAQRPSPSPSAGTHASASPAPSTSTATRAAAALPAEDLDALPDGPLSEESFESATTVISRAVLAHRDVERDADATPIAAAKPAPSLEAMVAKIPAETRDALEQLFRARFRGVRRITPEQLR